MELLAGKEPNVKEISCREKTESEWDSLPIRSSENVIHDCNKGSGH